MSVSSVCRAGMLAAAAPCASAIDENRDLGVRQYLDRLAAEYDRRHAAPSVRRHQNEIASLGQGGVDDRLVGMLVGFVEGLADDIRRLCSGCYGAQQLCGGLVYALLV